MKKFSHYTAMAAVSVAFMAVSCMPFVNRMDLQMRQPSESGYDFGGKDIGVVYASSDADSTIAKALAEGFANAMDKDYYNEENRIGFYRMPLAADADYSSRDTMLNLVMDTEKDVIFLLECLPVQKSADASIRLPLKVHIYDSMGKQDTVRTFSGTTLMHEETAKSANLVGERASRKFLSEWVPESFYFFYYDTSSKWTAANDAANRFNWHKAIEIWTAMVPDLSGQKLAMAAHNLASAAYILGDFSLAERWLEIAEKDDEMGYSATLRRKLDKKNQK